MVLKSEEEEAAVHILTPLFSKRRIRPCCSHPGEDVLLLEGAVLLAC